MRHIIHKITNIALIFMLIGAMTCQDVAYASNASHLRPPVLTNAEGGKELLKDGLGAVSRPDHPLKTENPLDFPNPIKEIKANQIKFIGQKHKQESLGLVTQEVIYVDEDERKHECFAKWWKKRISKADFIVSQARILRYLEKKGVTGIPKVRDLVRIGNMNMVLFDKFPKGETLNKKINKLSQDEAVDIILKVSRIVKSLFDNGVYHWDINPSNIYITDEGEVILFDYDLAFMTMEEFINRGLRLYGTSAYVSPSRNLDNISIKEEIYSLGVTLAEILPRLSHNEVMDYKQRNLGIILSKAVLSSRKDKEGKFLKYEDIPYDRIDEFIEDLEKTRGDTSKTAKTPWQRFFLKIKSIHNFI